MSAASEWGDSASQTSAVCNTECRVMTRKPMGLASLLVQKLRPPQLRIKVSEYLVNRCLLCDERKHYLIKDKNTGLFHFYCLECLAIRQEDSYPDDWWTDECMYRMRDTSLRSDKKTPRRKPVS